MRYPDFLKDGGTVGFIAPSFGASTEPYISCFDAALERFRKMGFRTVEGPNCRADSGVGKSNTPEECGREINGFFIDRGEDARADAIISCGGGETMCEDLPYVDFEGIARSKPRWFMGYSDNTNLTFTLPTVCDIAAIYGPNATAFGMAELHESLEDALDLIRGRKLAFENYPAWERESLKTPDDPFVSYNLTEPCGVKVLRSPSGSSSASFSGRLTGGCLDCLANLCGTRFDKARDFAEKYASDGIIWFLESCDLTVMEIRRALWELREAGWFRHASGFIFGRPYMYDDRFGDDGPQEAVCAALYGMDVPIVADADIGHLPPSMPVISGAYANVTAAPGKLRIEHILK